MRNDYRGVPPQVGRGWYEGRIPGPDEPTVSGLFRVNPVRRSATLTASCLVILGAIVLAVRAGDSSRPGGGLLLIVAALVTAILFIASLLLVWAVIDEARRRVRRRTSPDLTVLGLSTRTENILRRSGYETIADLTNQDDEELMSLPRMAEHDLRAIRKALSLHEYRDWQARGFPSR